MSLLNSTTKRPQTLPQDSQTEESFANSWGTSSGPETMAIVKQAEKENRRF